MQGSPKWEKADRYGTYSLVSSEHSLTASKHHTLPTHEALPLTVFRTLCPSLSLFLSLTHTHVHTHTFSFSISLTHTLSLTSSCVCGRHVRSISSVDRTAAGRYVNLLNILLSHRFIQFAFVFVINGFKFLFFCFFVFRQVPFQARKNLTRRKETKVLTTKRMWRHRRWRALLYILQSKSKTRLEPVRKPYKWNRKSLLRKVIIVSIFLQIFFYNFDSFDFFWKIDVFVSISIL